MRIFILFSAIVGICMSGAGPSLAYEEPWCVRANLGGEWVRDMCDFRTFELCSAERHSYGSTASCIHNPRYVPLAATGVRKKRKSER
jgi:uncharacterized protein DUF3551